MNKFYVLVSVAVIIFVLVFAINYLFSIDSSWVAITIISILISGIVFFGIRKGSTE